MLHTFTELLKQNGKLSLSLLPMGRIIQLLIFGMTDPKLGGNLPFSLRMDRSNMQRGVKIPHGLVFGRNRLSAAS